VRIHGFDAGGDKGGSGVRIGGRKERLNIISIPEVDPIVSR